MLNASCSRCGQSWKRRGPPFAVLFGVVSNMEATSMAVVVMFGSVAGAKEVRLFCLYCNIATDDSGLMRIPNFPNHASFAD